MKSLFKYGIVGSIAFVVDIALFYIAVGLIGINYFISGLMSFAVGVFVNYVLARSYVFDCDKNIDKRVEIAKVYIISSVAVVIHQATIYILVDVLGADIYVSKVVTSIVVMFWSYFARKQYVYTVKKK